MKKLFSIFALVAIAMTAVSFKPVEKKESAYRQLSVTEQISNLQSGKLLTTNLEADKLFMVENGKVVATMDQRITVSQFSICGLQQVNLQGGGQNPCSQMDTYIYNG